MNFSQFICISRNINKITLSKILCPFVLQNRNTYILKRTYPPPLSKVDGKHLKKLKRKHFIYELVEDTDLKEPPDLKIVLTTFVEDIGDIGDVISIMPQYARDHLLLPGKAVYATPENIEKYSKLKMLQSERPKYSSVNAGRTIRSLSKIVIPIFMSSEESWTIDKNIIFRAFQREGFLVSDDIELPPTPIQGPNLDNEGKDFAVTLMINKEEKFYVRCRLFHIKPGLEIGKLSDDFYLEKAEPILPEQNEILDHMPEPIIIKSPEHFISLVEKYRIRFIN